MSARLWLDGSIIDGGQTPVSLWNHSLHYGFGAFEGIRAYKTLQGVQPYKLTEHIDRLWSTCEAIGLIPNVSKLDIRAGVEQVLGEVEYEEAYVRPIVYMGDGLGALRDPRETHTAILVWEWKTGPENGHAISLGTAPYRRPDPSGYPCYAKATGNYLLSKTATLWALNNGYDDAIVLDHEGCVSEASAQNLFVVKNGRLVTPPTDRCLDGITRRTVIGIAKALGIRTEQRSFNATWMREADEVFLTSTASEVLPVAAVDRMDLPFAVGPVTSALRAAYREHVLDGKQRG